LSHQAIPSARKGRAISRRHAPLHYSTNRLLTMSSSVPHHNTASPSGAITFASNAVSALITTSCSATGRFTAQVLDVLKSGTVAKRGLAIAKSTITAGIGWLSAPSQLKTLYKVRPVSVQGESEHAFLGTASNKPSQIRPVMVSQDVIKNVLVVCNKDKIPEGVPYGQVIYQGDDAIKANTATKHFFYQADGVTIIENVEKVIARVPACFAIDYGAILQTGKMDQASYECLERMDDTGFTPWLVEILSTHDKEVQAAFLNDEDLKKYLPASSPTGHMIIASPFIKTRDIDDEDDDLEAEVETLQEECYEIVQRTIVPPSPLPTEAGSHKKASSKSLSDDEGDSKPASTNEMEATRLRILALGVTYDANTNKVTCLPTVSEHMEAIMRTSGGSTQRELTRQTLTSLKRIFGESTHFLPRSVDFPIMESITLAHGPRSHGQIVS